MRAIGPYEIVGELGRGAQGAVYRVRHLPTGAVRALKVLEGSLDVETVERFRREAVALARARGAVPVHEIGTDGGRPFIVMDLCPGGSLRDRMKTGKLGWRDATALVAHLARTLHDCHEAGLVHRDLKPENVLFDEHGEPVIADWGLVRDLGRTALTDPGSVLGTPAYMAPEQILGLPADRRADVFALAGILHELVSGERPFAGRTWREIHEAILAKSRASVTAVGAPKALDRALGHALEPELAARTTNALELSEELGAVLEGRVPDPARRSKIVVGSAFAAGVALVVVWLVALSIAVREPARDAVPSASPDPALAALKVRLAHAAPITSEGAPLALVGPHAELLELAARRAVIYDPGELASRCPADSPSKAALLGLALIGAIDSASRAKGEGLLKDVGARGPKWVPLVRDAAVAVDVVVSEHPIGITGIKNREKLRTDRWRLASLSGVLVREASPEVVASVLEPLTLEMRTGARNEARRRGLDYEMIMEDVELEGKNVGLTLDEVRKALTIQRLLESFPCRLVAAAYVWEPGRHDYPGLLEDFFETWWKENGAKLGATDPVLAAAVIVRRRGTLIPEVKESRGRELWLEAFTRDRAEVEALLARGSSDPGDASWIELLRASLELTGGLAQKTLAFYEPDATKRLEHEAQAFEWYRRALAHDPVEMFDGQPHHFTKAKRGIAVELAKAALTWKLEEVDRAVLDLLEYHVYAAEVERRRGDFERALFLLDQNNPDRAATSYKRILFAAQALAFADAGRLDKARAFLDKLGDDGVDIPGFDARGAVRAYVEKARPR